MYLAVVESVIKILERAGFKVTDISETRPRCFDVAAKKDVINLLIKALYNIDSLKSEMAEEMRALAKLLSSSPIVVGEKFKLNYLERGVVYNRYGLPVINTATFYDLIVEGIYPMVYSAPGGYYVKLDGKRIKEVRKKLGLSLGEVAKMLGVSRRIVKKYEEGVDASIENAIKLGEVLGTFVIKSVNILNFQINEEIKERKIEFNKTEEKIIEQLKDIGVRVYPIKHAPFDVISKTEDEAILTGVRQVKEIEKRALILGKVSQVLDTRAAYIVDKKIKKEIKSVVFLMRDELENISSPKDFITLLDEKAMVEKNI